MKIESWKPFIIVDALVCIGFAVFVFALLFFHTILIFKNLTSCKLSGINECRGIFIMDENFLLKGMA